MRPRVAPRSWPNIAAGPRAQPTLRPMRVPVALPENRQEERTTSAFSADVGQGTQKASGKGIFTVIQLSYTFSSTPRHRECARSQEKYHHSLQALAIRKDKIHAVDIPDQKLDGTPVYLDVEGLPDHDFYYLIGIGSETARSRSTQLLGR